MAAPKYKNWKEKRADELDVKSNPSGWFYFPDETHSDWYKLSTALEFANAAKKYGIDPFDFMALGVSESGLGNIDPSNPARIYWDAHPGSMKKFSEVDAAGNLKFIPTEEESRKQSIDFGAKFLAEKFKQYPDDRLKALQAYSGLGSTIYGGNPDVVEYMLGSKKAFGKPFQQINFAEEKPQAKRITRLSEKLKTVPELTQMVFSPSLMDLLQGKTNQPQLAMPIGTSSLGNTTRDYTSGLLKDYFRLASLPQEKLPHPEKVLGYPVREPHPSEMEFFKKRPEVSGMYTEDKAIIINPYSKLSDQERNAVKKLEAYRLWMDENKVEPAFSLTPEQVNKFKNIEYGKDPRALKLSIISRILVGDPSAGKVTPEQQEFANNIKSVVESSNVPIKPSLMDLLQGKTNQQQLAIPVGTSSLGNPTGDYISGLLKDSFRPDLTPKGKGFLGTLNRPGGKISTELSIGVNMGGKETLIPSLVPTLEKSEIDHLLSGGEPTKDIINKAVEHAQKRMSQGKSPFAQPGE